MDYLDIIAKSEPLGAEKIRQGMLDGSLVVPKNPKHDIKKPCAIGKGLKVKVNANIGASPDVNSVENELEKLYVAVKYGADTVMDLSIGAGTKGVLGEIIKYSQVPVGTVPIYSAVSDKSIHDITEDDIFDAIIDHGKAGVDFITVHCGVTQENVKGIEGRLTKIVSRGGALMYSWMKHTGNENPLFKYYDHLLDIAKEYGMTLSLGDGLRPGSIKDATDRPQVKELKTLGTLVRRAREKSVQVMVEGPGHIPMHQIRDNMLMEKEICHGAPFYVLGPIVTDVAPGYDHIVSAIGGAMAGLYGADFLCYVTPAEHLCLPSVDDVREGVIASRIAAHAVDISRGIDVKWDHEMSKARWERDWNKQVSLALDPEKARAYRERYKPKDDTVCTMCGDFCPMKNIQEATKPNMTKGYVGEKNNK